MSGLAIHKEAFLLFSGIHNNGVYSCHHDRQSSITSLIIKTDKMREKIIHFKTNGGPYQSLIDNLVPPLMFKIAMLDSADLDRLLTQLESVKGENPATLITDIIRLTVKCGSESNKPATRIYFLQSDMEAKSLELISKRAEDKKYADDYVRCREYLKALVLKVDEFFEYYSGNMGLRRFLLDESALESRREDTMNNALWFPDHPYHQQITRLLQFIVVEGQDQAWMKANHGNLGDQVYEYYRYQKQRNPTTLQVIIDHLNWPGHRKFPPKWTKEEIDQSIEDSSARQLEDLHQSFRQIQITTSSEEKAWTNAALPD